MSTTKRILIVVLVFNALAFVFGVGNVVLFAQAGLRLPMSIPLTMILNIVVICLLYWHLKRAR